MRHLERALCSFCARARDRGEDIAGLVGSDERLGVGVVEDAVFVEGDFEIGHAGECAATEAFVGDVAKEALDPVQPRGTGGGEGHMKAWVLGQPGLYLWLWLLVRGVVVHAQVHRLALGRTALDHLEKPQPRLMAMELIGHRQGFAGEHVQGGEQRADAVALVVVRHRLGAPFLHRQAGLGSLQCLNLRFLIAAQNQRVLGRVEVQAHDVVEFLNQARVVGQLEGVHAMGLQAGGTPDGAMADARVPR